MSIYISTGAFQTRHLPDILALCKQGDLTGLELSSGLPYMDNLEEILHDALHYAPLLLHNYFPAPQEPFVLNLAAADPDIADRSMALCRHAIQLSASIGAPFYSVHSGFAVNLDVDMLGKPETQVGFSKADDTVYEAAYIRFRERVATLSDFAATKGVRLLLENNVAPQEIGGNALLMTRAEHFLRLFDDLKHSNLGALVDVGHTYVSAHTLGFDPEDFIDTLAPHIEAFHVSENDGLRDSNQPVREDSWFLPHLKSFPKSAIVLEAYRLSLPDILEQRALLSRHINTPVFPAYEPGPGQRGGTSEDEINQRQHTLLS